MEPKRELTSVDLVALVRELAEYEGAKLDKAYLYDDDFLRLKLRDFERGRIELLIEVGEQKRAHLAAPEHVPDAPGRPPNFAMMLRSRLSGADFVGVEQYEFDRILTFHFEREDASTKIVVELFGEGNVAVLDETDRVLDSLETVRLKSRTVAPGATYEYPSTRVNPLTVDAEEFAVRMDESGTDVVRTLATQLNFGGLYAEELCTRAGVAKTTAIDEATEDEYDRLFGAIERLATALEREAFEPRVYAEDDRYVDATPIPLEEYEGLESESFDSFNEALDAYFFAMANATDERPGTERPDFQDRIERHERIVAQQEGAIEQFDEQADEEREKAELLYAHYGLVDEVLSTVREAREHGTDWEEIEATLADGAKRGIPAAEAVVGVDGSDGTVRIDLDGHRIDVVVRDGVEKNADRLYTEAKRIQEKKAGAEEAIAETREELAALRRERDRWEAGEAGIEEEEASDGDEGETDWLALRSVPVRPTEEWYERFRWFHTSDGFLVIGGRNADQNEELVKKYLERGDRFFHAQAHGAPVTILKATGPSEAARAVEFPAQTLDEAAQFAVSYSSVWKAGQFAGDAYAVDPDQVSKTPESGEYLEEGAFAVRGERTYYDDVAVGVAVGIACEPWTRVIGGPPSAIRERAEVSFTVEPGEFAQGDVAKRLYREFRERFADTSFVRKVASPDLIQEFLPPGTSRITSE